MAETGHTPGPWQITRAKGLPHAIVAPHPEIGTIPVATVVIANHHEANASLMAAAPELLSALKAFHAAGKDVVKAGGGAPAKWNFRELQDAWQAARDLIAKAEGR
jgi:hypothetical protein